MAAPRPRPAALKLIEGRGPGRDSGGRAVRQAPGFVRLPPSKPQGMSPVAARLWDDLVPELQRLQLTKPVDGPALEMLCESYSRWHAARAMRLAAAEILVDDDTVIPHVRGLLGKTSQGWNAAPWIGIEERASKEYRSWCIEFGLTPAAETGVSKDGGAGGDEGNPFAGTGG